MTKTDKTHGEHAQKSHDGIDPSTPFLLDKNLRLPTDEPPWRSILPAAGIIAQQSTDLVRIIIGHDNCKPPVVVVRESLDEATCKTLLDALVAWMPGWDAVYGAFKPYYYADESFFHDLDELPANM